jgi:hypothetical protein
MATVASWGFNPTDEGYTLAWSQRLLQGAIPHRDLVSFVPLASGYFHIIDFIGPGSLIMRSRAITAAEIAIYSLALCVLAFKAHSSRLSHTSLYLTALIAFAVNAHSFPFMAWTTIDAAFVSAIGFGLLGTNPLQGKRTGRNRMGLVALGMPALFRQSMGLITLFAAALMCMRAWRRRSLRDGLKDACFLIAPVLAWCTAMLLMGALPEMIAQVIRASTRQAPLAWLAAYQPLVQPSAATLVACAAPIGLRLMLTYSKRMHVNPTVQWAIAIASIGILLMVAFDWNMGGDGTAWGCALLVDCIAFLLIEWMETRTIQIVGLELLVLALGVSLSFGYAVPNLVAGSLLAYMLISTLACSPAPSRQNIALVLMGGLTSLSVGAWVVVRATNIYRDRPLPSLTRDLGSLSGNLAGVRTNPITYQYLKDMVTCVQNHPASSVALLPDNSALYPVLGLHDPVASPWLVAVSGDPQKVNQSLDNIRNLSSYLVVFQLVSAADLSNMTSLPVASWKDEIYDPSEYPPLRPLLDSLPGDRILCGSLIAIWKPMH